MEEWCREHLENWLEINVVEEERESLRNKILQFVEEYPDLINDHSWTEIRNLIERNERYGMR